MLPQVDAQRLIDRYFDFAMPTYRFLHQPTVQKWFVEFYETLGTMRDPHTAPAKLALLFIIFALARVYMPDDDKPGPSDLRLVSLQFQTINDRAEQELDLVPDTIWQQRTNSIRRKVQCL